ncbi:MAG: hypothetical protein IJV15_05075 [Lachnospiraceae bacterium]|nr:hypothetical protein [Lachnospiraceae bacterium]
MSQAKVDRYKEEKKNREKNLKKKRAQKYIGVIVLALLIGACIGYPLGKKLYKINAERRAANETIAANYYDAWLQNYWNANYTGTLGFPNTEEATSSDAYTDTEEGSGVDDASDNTDVDSSNDTE